MQEAGLGIAIDGLVKSYKRGKVKALNGVSLRIESGEAFGIIGPNGAGKTTLFGCLLGFLRMDEGSITIDGMPPDYMAVRRMVGYLPERLDFDRWMSGYDFMTFHYALLRRPPESMETEVEELLNLVELDKTAWKRPLGKYSRGMLQRLGLAQAMIGKPRFLFLDEPASGVDPGGVLLFRKILRQLHEHGVTILLNSHQLEQVERICHRVAFVKGGRVDAVEVVGEQRTASDGILIVRWRSNIDHDMRATIQKATVEQSIAAVIECTDQLARFSIGSDDQTTELIRFLVDRNVPVVHVSKEEQSLERLFVEQQKNGGEETASADKKEDA